MYTIAIDKKSFSMTRCDNISFLRLKTAYHKERKKDRRENRKWKEK